MSRVDIIDMVRIPSSEGGRGRFPTGIKWNFAAGNVRPRYNHCANADEVSRTFKDADLERIPDLVMEGMTIGARATGAALGLVYLRPNTLPRRHLKNVVKRRKKAAPGLNIAYRGLQLQHHGGHGRRRIRVRRRDGPHES